MNTCLLPLAFTIVLSVQVTQAKTLPDVRDDDIIFHRSQSRQSQAIAVATRSELTHPFNSINSLS